MYACVCALLFVCVCLIWYVSLRACVYVQPKKSCTNGYVYDTLWYACIVICAQFCIPSNVAMHSPGQLPFHKCEELLGMLEQARHQVALSIIKDPAEKRGLLLSVCRVRYTAQQFIHTFAFTDRCFSLTVLLATLHSSNVHAMHFRVGCQLSHFRTPRPVLFLLLLFFSWGTAMPFLQAWRSVGSCSNVWSTTTSRPADSLLASCLANYTQHCWTVNLTVSFEGRQLLLKIVHRSVWSCSMICSLLTENSQGDTKEQ